MKCSRPKCRKRVRAAGLCHVHHASAAANGVLLSGLTSPDRSWAHVEYLLGEGVSLAEIGRATGLSWGCLNRIRNGFLVLKTTEAKILKVQPGLGQRVAAEAKVPALGTRRRLQALAAIGWDTGRLAQRLGVPAVTVWRYLNRSERVEVYMARKVETLFTELHLTAGPSVRARTSARKKTWVSSLAWDCIDDPAEVPNTGAATVIRFPDRYREVVDVLGIRGEERIAAALGMSGEALDRQLHRYGIKGSDREAA